MTRVSDVIWRALARTPAPTTSGKKTWADFRRFWELAHKVKGNISIGLTTEQAKAEASELFHRAKLELTYTQEQEQKHVP